MKKVEAALGEGADIRFEIVDEIPHEASGKFREYVSLVKNGCRGLPTRPT